ncbi:MAG: FkbM family methyltransferase [Flammeovirgaceae bacterium]
MNHIKSYIKSVFFKLISNYKIPDSVFIGVINLFFLFLKKNHRFKLSKLGAYMPKYKVISLDNSKEKFFGFRKQGLMAFSNGIKQRGNDIGEAYLLNKIKFNEGDIIFDVGANTGDLRIYFNNKKIKIKYFGFEPGKIEFESLKRNNLNDNIFNSALGKANDVLPFYYYPEYGDSSLIEMKGYSEKYNVSVQTLSDFIKKNKLTETKIKLIKLEAEGYEPEILEGLDIFSKNVEYISADLGFERGINQESTFPESKDFLIKRNFKIICINERRKVVLFKNKNFEN